MPRPRRSPRARGAAPLPPDGGFTLVEAVVAMALFAVVLAAAGLAVGRALQGTGATNRSVTATTVANEALEQARALSTQQDPTGRTALLTGRPALTPADVADLALGDTTLAPAGDGGPALLPFRTVRTVGGVDYTVRTVVGTCLRPAAGGPCGTTTSVTRPVTMYRVIAAVTWPGCTARECPVTASTLIDTAQDPAFNTLLDLPPTAVDKTFCTAGGTDLILDPTYKSYSLKDTGLFGTSPVVIDAAPPAQAGTLTWTQGSSIYTFSPGTSSGSTSFTYHDVDTLDRRSNPATITIQVGRSC